jgi:hypothetical protein
VFDIKPLAEKAVYVKRFNRSDKPDWIPLRSVTLLDRALKLRGSLQTEMVCVYWIRAFVL